jgi:hypothetical protein
MLSSRRPNEPACRNLCLNQNAAGGLGADGQNVVLMQVLSLTKNL